eukprot:scaffold6159_cov207-Cylindrotheca_fusiformis.AAC.4
MRLTQTLNVEIALIISFILLMQKCNAFHSPSSKYCEIRQQVQNLSERNLAKFNLDSVKEEVPLSDSQKGVLVLLTVPMAWGTFEPAVRLVYQIQPDIPPFAFSLAYYLVATIPLCLLSLTEHSGEKQTDSSSKTIPVIGGLELGTYLFLGNALQVIGLKSVPSDRAAFLLQLTTIFVPLVQSIIARNMFAIQARTWLACIVALLGVVLIGAEGTNDVVSTFRSLQTVQLSTGDNLIILGALFYSFHCIRLEFYAKQIPSAVTLAATKAITETVWTSLVLSACFIAAQTDSLTFPIFDELKAAGNDLLRYQESFQTTFVAGEAELQLKFIAALLWTGIVTIAYTITAQTYGQSRVPPTTANLIYTIQPFFTAVIAFLVLGERLGAAGYAGGTLIAMAVLLVVSGDQKEPSKNDCKNNF